MGNVDDHYIVLVGDVCDAARLAKLPVRVTTRAGQSVLGVPETALARQGEPGEIDDTGYLNRLVIGGVTVALDQVVEVRLAAPQS